MTEFIKKFYFKQWIIGFVFGDIEKIIRTKSFPQNISWVNLKSMEHFHADPFILERKNGYVSILFEDFSIKGHYGNISLMTLDSKLKPVDQKVLLDTGSHLSFPFIVRENNRVFVFPESTKNGKLSCYEYKANEKKLVFVKDILDMPLYDSAILKHEGKYWLFGSLFENRKDYKLHIFYSSDLLGPYIPHPGNPVKNGLDGTRAAGDFIRVGSDIFRPAQNCEKEYGESITINRINVLNETAFDEEPYMKICINPKISTNSKIHTIHTINVRDNLIVVDGIRWTFSIYQQLKNSRRNRRILKKIGSH